MSPNCATILTLLPITHAWQNIYKSMKLEKIDLGETGNFSPIFLDYIQNNQKLQPFYKFSPKLSSFKEALATRSFSQEKRELLYKVLKSQYQELPENRALKSIELLRASNTFTITTGHQLNIFTGPLYFIYKIVTVINACKQLKEAYPEADFVPVYWMASEDHDFEEINHFLLFGEKYQWDTEQKGPVGRFDTSSIQVLIDSLPEKAPLFEEAYTHGKTLAEATRNYVHALFGDEGLVVVDADHRDFKKGFTEIVKDDILHNIANELVSETSEALSSLGYKSQIHPREINFFYMEDGLRERIVKEEGRFKVLHTDLVFSKDDLLNLVEDSPEKFSPNVVMRPLYEEVLLPNLAYIGGPAEVAYWLQLKSVFEHYKVDFPIIMPRNFGLIINKSNAKKVAKLGVSSKDLFLSLHELKQQFLEKHTDNGMQLEEEKGLIEKAFEMMREKAERIDKSLTGFVSAEVSKTFKSLENISKRLHKSEEKNQEVSMGQLENLKEKLFPGGGLQERKENILNFYLNNPEIIKQFIELFDPFDYRFNIMIEDE